MKIRLAVLLALMLSLMLPITAKAGTGDNIEITVGASDEESPPGSPSDLTAVVNTGNTITLTWSHGLGATGSVLLRKVGGYPSSYSDNTSVVIYTGTAEVATDPYGVSDSEEDVYYRVWSYNSFGYSAGYDETSVKGRSTMALVMIPIIGITLTGLVAWKWKLFFLAFPAFITWIAFFVYCKAYSAGSMDFYAIMAYVGLVMAFICVFLPFVVYKTQNPANRTPPKSESEKFGDEMKQMYKDIRNARGF